VGISKFSLRHVTARITSDEGMIKNDVETVVLIARIFIPWEVRALCME